MSTCHQDGEGNGNGHLRSNPGPVPLSVPAALSELRVPEIHVYQGSNDRDRDRDDSSFPPSSESEAQVTQPTILVIGGNSYTVSPFPASDSTAGQGIVGTGSVGQDDTTSQQNDLSSAPEERVPSPLTELQRPVREIDVRVILHGSGSGSGASSSEPSSSGSGGTEVLEGGSGNGSSFSGSGAHASAAAGQGGAGNGNGGNDNSDPPHGSDHSTNSTAELVSTNEVIYIQDQAMNEPANVSAALSYCENRLLSPYLRLLGIVGLKPSLKRETEETGTLCLVLHKLYFFIVIIIVLTGYILQYLSCFRRDRGFMYKDDFIGKNASEMVKDEASYENPLHTICLGNPVLIHLLPSIFHFSSFIYMIYLYRFNDDEQLPNLMERVFIQAAFSHNQFVLHKKVISILQWLAFSSILWVLASTACQLIQIWTHTISFTFQMSYVLRISLTVILAVSTTWQDAIQVTVIISYCIHCILLSTYLEFLHSRVQQHTITLNECIKEIGELERLTGYLNNDLSPGLGPLLILNGATAVSSVVFLASNSTELQILDFVSVVLVSTLWIMIFLFPLIEAANLSSAYKKIREIGHLVRLRPFGYQYIPQADLDSFLLFVSTLEIDVRILKIPVSAPILACVFTFFAFVTLSWGLFLSSFMAQHTIGIGGDFGSGR